jgi:hypothetical protein
VLVTEKRFGLFFFFGVPPCHFSLSTSCRLSKLRLVFFRSYFFQLAIDVFVVVVSCILRISVARRERRLDVPTSYCGRGQAGFAVSLSLKRSIRCRNVAAAEVERKTRQKGFRKILKSVPISRFAAMAAIVDMGISRTDQLSLLRLPAEKLVLLPSPRYPSMPRFAVSRPHCNIDETEIRSAIFKVSW